MTTRGISVSGDSGSEPGDELTGGIAAPRGVVELDSSFKAFANDHAAKLVARMFDNPNQKNKVVDIAGPEKMREAIEFAPPVSGENKSFQELSDLVDKVLHFSVRTAHPMYFNQLWAEADPIQVLGEWMATALNHTMYTFEVAGPFLLMEEAVKTSMRRLLGFPEGKGSGIMCPGGSMCNLHAVSLARHAKFPDTKKTGLFGLARCIIYTSAESHYSLTKAAFTCGFGTDNICKISTIDGKMNVEELAAKCAEHKAAGFRPFMVNATAGTTVRGYYDPFNEIADVCEANDMWFHIDGAWGGGCLMSSKYKAHMAGASRADSVTWDGHKMLGSPHQAAFLLLKDTGTLLEDCNGTKASYLFQPDKPYAELDTGDKHVMCGRRNDILKFWLAWQVLGNDGYDRRVTTIFDTARYMAKTIKARQSEGFVLICEPECTNVCFYHIPTYLQADPVAKEMMAGNVDALREESSAAFVEKLKAVPPLVKVGMMNEGSMMCGFQPDMGLPNFWRFIVANPRTTPTYIDDALNIIQRLGEATVPVAE